MHRKRQIWKDIRFLAFKHTRLELHRRLKIKRIRGRSHVVMNYSFLFTTLNGYDRKKQPACFFVTKLLFIFPENVATYGAIIQITENL